MKNMKITVKIYGGLGNQMFQYAAGRALSLRHHVPLDLDIQWFFQKQNSTTARPYHLNIFKNITASVQKKLFFPCPAILHRIKNYLPYTHIIREPHFAYWPEFSSITPPATLDGYWQCEKYFMEFRKEIRDDFTFPPLPEAARQLFKQIANTPESVSVHVRRGDYVSNPQAQAFHGNLQQEYYNKSLQLIKDTCGKTKLFIFSDDPIWVRNNFNYCGHDATIVELGFPNAPYHDMHLMTLCKHHIIANSTFSWWGAWLKKQSGLTISPKCWFANSMMDSKDIHGNGWIII